MRIALVHDWLVGMRGGEKCLEVLCRLWPRAHLYTLIQDRPQLAPAIARMSIRTSFLQALPGVRHYYRQLLPLMPLAVEHLRLSGYDLVLSLSHCVAKSVRVPRGVPHICYCFTPMRYAWQMREAYLGARAEGDPVGSMTNLSGAERAAPEARRVAARWVLPPLLDALRQWDRSTARRVSQFVAISRTVQQRIRQCYDRDSLVIHPPVDVNFYRPQHGVRDDFYLCVSALVPYKRLDIAISACARLGRKLVVIGSGPDERRLRAVAGPHVTFLGWQSNEVIRQYYRRCRALLFPGLEDFGIVPLEAQACGTPVIALGAGGTAETVLPATAARAGTGLLFEPQTCVGLIEAMLQFESGRFAFSSELARQHAESFDEARFARQMLALVKNVLGNPSQVARSITQAA